MSFMLRWQALTGKLAEKSRAIVVLSINTLLLYFYYNSFAPVLSQMAKDYRFSDAERDSLIGTTLFLKL